MLYSISINRRKFFKNLRNNDDSIETVVFRKNLSFHELFAIIDVELINLVGLSFFEHEYINLEYLDKDDFSTIIMISNW